MTNHCEALKGSAGVTGTPYSWPLAVGSAQPAIRQISTICKRDVSEHLCPLLSFPLWHPLCVGTPTIIAIKRSRPKCWSTERVGGALIGRVVKPISVINAQVLGGQRMVPACPGTGKSSGTGSTVCKIKQLQTEWDLDWNCCWMAKHVIPQWPGTPPLLFTSSK